MCSTRATATYSDDQRDLLLDLARKSIEYGLNYGKPFSPNPADYDESLRKPRAVFVTLHRNGELRGCIGTLEAELPLVDAICVQAFNAAFYDSRFQQLKNYEFEGLDIHISVLSEASPLSFESERELLEIIRPNIDGLILSIGKNRSLFLPSVWKSLETPSEFLNHLKLKAGLPADFWSDQIRVDHFTTESFQNVRKNPSMYE
jgi:AmmeMemoRadiSam system protein A